MAIMWLRPERLALLVLTYMFLVNGCLQPDGKDFTFRFNRWYYLKQSPPAVYSDAEEHCLDAGARLIQIESQDDLEALKEYGFGKIQPKKKNNLVITFVSEEETWIGLSESNGFGVSCTDPTGCSTANLTWSDGTELDLVSSRFDLGIILNPYQTCASTATRGSYQYIRGYGGRCDSLRFAFLCQSACKVRIIITIT